MASNPNPSPVREKSPGPDSDVSTEEPQRQEAAAPVARRRKPANRQPQHQQMQRRRRGGGPLGGVDELAGLDGVGETAQGLTSGVTNTLGNVAGTAVQNQGDGGGAKKDTLKLRLDLNLDIEITLKARIHGDLELALL
jgi:hypothetical protein